VVRGSTLLVGQDAIGLGQLGGALGGHILKFPAEVLDLVRVVARDLNPERALDLVAGRGGRNLEELIKGFHFLNSATLAGGSSRRLASRSSRSLRFGGRFAVSTVLFAQYGQ